MLLTLSAEATHVALLAQDMAWCQEYAMQNRQAMRRLMEEAVAEVTGAQPDHARAVNIHHNFWRAGAQCLHMLHIPFVEHQASGA